MGEDWNIDDYRAAHESEEHWMLRREFMEVNKSKFPRIRVLSLSQVFANMEFLGCKYPAETMQLVSELSEGIVEEYRQKQKNRLQRTFVNASTAAEKKSKGDATHSHESESKTEIQKSNPDTKAYKKPLYTNFVSAGHLSESPSTSKDKNQAEPKRKSPNQVDPEQNPLGAHNFERSVKSVVTNLLNRSSASSSTSAATRLSSTVVPFSSATRFNSPAVPFASATRFNPAAVPFSPSAYRSSTPVSRFSPVTRFDSTTKRFSSPTNRFRPPDTRFSSPGTRDAGSNTNLRPKCNPSPGIRPLMSTAVVVPKAKAKSKPTNEIKESTNLNELVLVEQLYTNDTPAQIINRSCSMSKVRTSYKNSPPGKNGYIYSINIGTEFLVEGAGLTKDAARNKAADVALERLRKICYTIQIKQPMVGTGEVGKVELDADVKSPSNRLGASNALAPAVDQNNIGNKMLRLMGWTGGALGKNEEGLKEAIDVSESIGRQRLGLGSSNSLVRAKVLSFLESHLALTDKQDIIFSPEFSSVEREVIHKAATMLGLKSRSHGKDEDRFIVVSRKISILDLLKELLDTGETPKYRVVKPSE